MTEAQTRTEGKAVVVENGGQPWTLLTDRIPVGNSGTLELSDETIDLTLAPASGQAPWSRGHVEVVADLSALAPSSPAADWFYLEVNVIGEVGTVQTVIARLALGPLKTVGRVPLYQPYEKILFQSRQATSDVEGLVTPSSLGFTAVARIYR